MEWGAALEAEDLDLAVKAAATVWRRVAGAAVIRRGYATFIVEPVGLRREALVEVEAVLRGRGGEVEVRARIVKPEIVGEAVAECCGRVLEAWERAAAEAGRLAEELEGELRRLRPPL